LRHLVEKGLANSQRMKLSVNRMLLLLMLLKRLGAAAPVPPPLSGTLSAAVVDGAGSYVLTPKLYAYSEELKRSFEAEGSSGLVSLSLPPGRYRVYSAYIKKHGDFVERYISHEARVQVASGENASVILKTTQTTPSRVYLSENARKKIGLDPELAQFLN
jgi:hypothetical protein